MNIFILEDDDYKYNDLKNVILGEYPNAKLTRRKYLNPAKSWIKTRKGLGDISYDLFIIDMQLPNYEDQPYNRVRSDAGKDFVYYLSERLGLLKEDNYFIFSSNKPSDDDELDWVVYDTSSLDWCSEVLNRIKEENGKVIIEKDLELSWQIVNCMLKYKKEKEW